jgi:hypothetical protein
MIKMIGEVRYDSKIKKYRGHLTANNGEATVVLFTCTAEKAENARTMVNGYAQGMVKQTGRDLHGVAWMKEWEVANA